MGRTSQRSAISWRLVISNEIDITNLKESGVIELLVGKAAISPIVIEGFCGAGKSTITKILAEHGLQCLETDEIIKQLGGVHERSYLDQLLASDDFKKLAKKENGWAIEGHWIRPALEEVRPQCLPSPCYVYIKRRSLIRPNSWDDMDCHFSEALAGLRSRADWMAAKYHQEHRPHERASMNLVRFD